MHLGCTLFLGLHGLDRPHHPFPVARRLCIPALTTSANVNSHPIHYAWDRFSVDVQGHCLNVDRFFIGSGSVNCALNFVIFVLVCPRYISSSPELPTDTETADTTLVSSSYDCEATNSPDSSVHLGWLVCPTNDLFVRR